VDVVAVAAVIGRAVPGDADERVADADRVKVLRDARALGSLRSNAPRGQKLSTCQTRQRALSCPVGSTLTRQTPSIAGGFAGSTNG
jgi:hypothetical protein